MINGTIDIKQVLGGKYGRKTYMGWKSNKTL